MGLDSTGKMFFLFDHYIFVDRYVSDKVRAKIHETKKIGWNTSVIIILGL